MKTRKATTKQADEAEIRKHYYLDEYVIIAPRRRDRPFNVSGKNAETVSIKKSKHSIEDDPSVFEIPDESGKWKIKVVENLYPALSPSNNKAFGIQEIVLETSRANTLFSELSEEHISQIFLAYRHRLDAIRRNNKIKHISVFKNHGYDAGGSLAHTHSQIIGIDFIPTQLSSESQRFTNLKKQYGGSPLGAALEWERNQQERVIGNSIYATAIAPYASRFPLEAWIIPHRPVSSICELDNHELLSMAQMLKSITKALDSKQISFNFYLNEPAMGFDNHFSIRITPRPNIWAGFELSTRFGVVINPVSPEKATTWYSKFFTKK
jgi:UDPglucose--hexose-1-phosphate uridylyltransferase